MWETKNLRFLQNILEGQKNKILNRIWFTLFLLLIPLLLFVVNTLTVTIHLVDNPIELVIFLYFILIGAIFWSLETIIKNFFGWKTLKQVQDELLNPELNLLKLNETKTKYYFFNSWYQTINKEIATITNNPNFTFLQNQKSIKFQNWRNLFLLLTWTSLVIGFFITEIVYFHQVDFNNWSILLSFIVMMIYLVLILPWVVIRQIILNIKYHRYLNQLIDNYDFIFSMRWLWLKPICEKLED